MTANRRDFLKAATGLVAATAVGGALFHSGAETAQAAPAQGVAHMNMSVRIDGFSNEFPARMAQIGVTNAGATVSGGGGGAGKPLFQNVVIEKQYDGFSPALYLLAASGQHIKEVGLTLRDPQGSPIGSIKLIDAYVASCGSSIDGSGNGDSLESIEFVYEKIMISHLGSQFAWDIKANRKI